MLHSLIYVSTAIDKLSLASFSSLAQRASDRNALLDVTGILLYSDGNFMQCLEGPKESIDILMKTIAADPRHFGLMVLWEGKISKREFPGWGMTLRSPDVGFRAIPCAPADHWFKHSPAGKKSPVRVLLEGFWSAVDTGSINRAGQ
jgi:hypothetical protein